MRLRNPKTGVVVNVSDERGKQLRREGYESADATRSSTAQPESKPAKRPTTRRKS